MFNIQVLALTLIPLLSGGAPQDGRRVVLPLEMLGMSQEVSREFMVGTWRNRDQFSRWGVKDRTRATLRPMVGQSSMTLKEDGSVEMVNLFSPAGGRWEIARQGIVIYDPKRPEAGSRLIPVRIRAEDRIWLLLPFAGGATGIGMERVSDVSHASKATGSRRPAVHVRPAAATAQPTYDDNERSQGPVELHSNPTSIGPESTTTAW